MLKRSVRRPVSVLLGVGALLSALGGSASPANARHHHHARAAGHYARHSFARHAHASNHGVALGGETANFAAIVVDANTGHTLYARNENELRHPASITKVMTLYLLFEQLERGRLHLQDEIPVSAHAASQRPTKLGLRPGSTITVENAIKAVVTRSANDMAVAIAEAVGGDEGTFAEMMTRKAHALGMSHTEYHNASGLPHDQQWTSARDLAVLGRAIQERFPRYYAFFSTHVFYFHGQAIANHNHLLDRVEGMDGIKTGYTNASGFNILTSVKRNGHFLVSVVMGGRSAAGRDRIMAGLIDRYIDDTGTTRTAAAIGENGAQDADDEAATTVVERKPAPVKVAETIAEPSPRLREPAPTQVASLGTIVPVERAKPAFVPGTPRAAATDDAPATTATIRPRHVGLDGSTAPTAGRGAASATPSTMHWVVGPQASRERAAEAPVKVAKLETTRTDARAETPHVDSARPTAARGGWVIQIGATDDATKASDLLARAKSQAHELGGAKPYTEKVQKGAATLYRARFAGLEENTAETACRSLKRSGFACFATKN